MFQLSRSLKIKLILKKCILKFSDSMKKKPRFMCVITANFKAVVKDPETGIYLLPITALRP